MRARMCYHRMRADEREESMTNIFKSATTAFLLTTSMVSAQPAIPRPDPTPRDIYVGCYLYIQGIELPRDDQGLARPYSAAKCGGLAVLAIAHREGRVPGQRNDLRFCLPDTADVDTAPAALRSAYRPL